MNECTKAALRRIHDSEFANRYFVGVGIDVGAGDDGLDKLFHLFPQMISCRPWDKIDGDAQYLKGVGDNSLNFLHSSHCLEHLVDPFVALANWIRVVKSGGHLVIMVPDEDLYEQRVFPSTFNSDHKRTFTIDKANFGSWSERSLSLVYLIQDFLNDVKIIRIQLLEQTFDYSRTREDQTLDISESAIEFVLRKL